MRLVLVFTLLTSGIFSALSAQGLVAFSSYRDGNADIYITDANGQNEQRLTSDPAWDGQPRISPNGDKILFCSQRPSRVELFVMNTDGSGVTQVSTDGIGEVSNGSGTYVWSAWSPDGTYILFGHENQLIRVLADGSQPTVLATSPDGRVVNTPDWSPAGNKILFRTYQPYWGYVTNTYVMNVDGSNIQLLIGDQAGGESGPRISSDGLRVLYSWDHSGHEEPSGRSLDHRIHIIGIDGSNDLEISPGKPANTNDFHACWITNDRILFVNQDSAPNSQPNVWTMNTDGSDRQLFAGNANEPDWHQLSCAPTSVPFVDNFEGSLDTCWAWTSEDSTHWSLSARAGWLQIVTQYGIPYDEGEGNNMLLRRQPVTDYVAEVHLQISPTENHHGAGLILFKDADHKLVLHRHFTEPTIGQCIALQHDGACGSEAFIPTQATDVHLRLTVRGESVESAWSEDGVNWSEIALGSCPWIDDTDTKIGLIAFNGYTTAPEIPADFEYFMMAPATGTVVCGDVSGTWDAAGSPYLVSCDLFVPVGDTLVIEPGVSLQFMGPYKLTVEGTLLAEGTETDSIVFTTDTLANPGRWRGIRFLNGNSDGSEMSFCVIEHVANRNWNWPDVYGAIWSHEASPSISHCDIRLNYANRGGGLGVTGSSLTRVSDCAFSNNGTDEAGGAIEVLDGGSPTVERSLFVGNYALNNGGAFAVGIDGSGAQIRYCVFTGNSCQTIGSALVVGGGTTVVLDHCTIVGNTSSIGQLGAYSYCDLTVSDCIVAAGTSSGFYCEENSNVNVRHTDLYGNIGGVCTGSCPAGLGLLTQTNRNADSCDAYFNIFLDPLFVDGQNGDYHLQSGSPCIDTGDPTLYDPDCTVSDMGAFYFHHLAQPESLVVIQEGNDMVLHWTIVDSTDCQFPSPIQSYVIFYEEDFGENWNYLSAITDTVFRHQNVTLFAPSMCYEVIATDISIASIQRAIGHRTQDLSKLEFGHILADLARSQ